MYIGAHKDEQVFAWGTGSIDETTTVQPAANNQANGNDQFELDGAGNNDHDDDDEGQEGYAEEDGDDEEREGHANDVDETALEQQHTLPPSPFPSESSSISQTSPVDEMLSHKTHIENSSAHHDFWKCIRDVLRLQSSKFNHQRYD